MGRMRTTIRAANKELRLAKRLWGTSISRYQLSQLKELIRTLRISVGAGDIHLLDGKWYVTHSGLLRLARRKHCLGIKTAAISNFCDPSIDRYAFRATVFTSRTCRGFVGYGDADPSNVSTIVRGAEMRIAETRAVNRALRKAYGIGICSIEEIGSSPVPSDTAPVSEKLPPKSANGNGYGGPKVRDRLCQIIRQHQLDASLVKAYATDFCGVKSLREATREQVENFVVSPGRLGREGPQCPALSAQQLPTATERTRKVPRETPNPRIERDGPGLSPTLCPTACSLSASTAPSTAGIRRSPSTSLRLSVLEPRELAGRLISGRVYCTAKALWKLGWFLRDFLYDPDLLGREEVDEKALSGLRGVVKISHTTVNGTSLLNFDGFAPASQWAELSSASCLKNTGSEVA